MGMVASAHGCAVLVPMNDPGGTGRDGLRASFEIGACPFGSEGPGLAARLAGHVRDWDAAGRPSLAGLRVSAYPAGAGPSETMAVCHAGQAKQGGSAPAETLLAA